jgi:amino acid permease
MRETTNMSTAYSVPGDKGGLTEKHYARGDDSSPERFDDSFEDFRPVADTTHRKLKPRHIQLIGIGG